MSHVLLILHIDRRGCLDSLGELPGFLDVPLFLIVDKAIKKITTLNVTGDRVAIFV